MIGPDDPHVVFLDLETATTPPAGIIMHYKDRWWSYAPGRGLILHRSRRGDPPSPQCNPNEAMARHLQQKLWPWAETRFVPSVFIRVNPRDYT